MKKLFFIFLLVPIAIIAQIEENKVVPEKVEKQQIEVPQVPQDIVDANTKTEKQEPTIVVPECTSGDCKDGQGIMKYRSGTYVGDWKDGLRNGQGKFTWNNNDTYDGTWVEDKRHGQGIYVWHDGSKYNGNYSHDIRSGYGIYYYTNGTIYEGTWQNNLKHGIANFYYKESVNIGGRYFNNEYVSGTGITKETYKYKPE